MWADHNNIITFTTWLKYSPISYAHLYYLMLVLVTVFRYYFGTFDTKLWWCLLLIQLFRDHSGTMWRMKCTGCQKFYWYAWYFDTRSKIAPLEQQKVDVASLSATSSFIQSILPIPISIHNQFTSGSILQNSLNCIRNWTHCIFNTFTQVNDF